MALQPLLGVPIGFAVADEIEYRHVGGLKLGNNKLETRDQDVYPQLFIRFVIADLVAGLAHRDVRRVGVLHADDMIAGVDVMYFAGDAARHVGEQIRGRLADILDGDVAAQRRVVLVPFENVAEIADGR